MNRWGLGVGIVAVLFVTGHLACSGCSDGTGTPVGQAGHSGDAASDARTDADARPSDGPSDAPQEVLAETDTGEAATTDAGEWVTSPYAAFAGCAIEHLANPEAVPKYEWLPCEGVPTECHMLDTSVLPGTGPYKFVFGAKLGSDDNPRFLVGRGIGDEMMSPTLFQRDGTVVAAWRSVVNAPCSLRGIWVNKDEVALTVLPTEELMHSMNITQRVVVGSASSVVAGTAEQYDLRFDIANLNGIENASVSDTMVVVDGQPGGRLFVAQRPAGLFEEVPRPGALWSKHVLIGDELIAGGYEGKGNLYIRHPNGDVEPYRAAPERGEAIPGGDSQIIGWQEGVNGSATAGFESVEVWAAPFTNDPAALVPYKVTDLPNASTYPAEYGEGWYMVQLDPLSYGYAGKVRMVQLTTSTYVDLDPPTGYGFTELVGIAGGEAWFLLRAFPGAKEPVTIARMSLAGLEPLLH